MSVGMPGTGIGGLFYLLSAVLMPLRAAYRSARSADRHPARWRLAIRQAAMACGIFAGIWLVGWLLGVVPGPSSSAVTTRQVASGDAPRHLLLVIALVASVGTLAAVLLAVEVARLVVRRPSHRPAFSRRPDRPVPAPGASPESLPNPEGAAVSGALVVLLVLGAQLHGGGSLSAQTAQAEAAVSDVWLHLARADSAFAAGQHALARQEYLAVLAANPDNSRATYRLAQLSRGEPARALELFRRYVELEPADPWGYIAVGDELARAGDFGGALRWYDDAVHRAPGERDAVVGRARLLARAGRTEAAIAGYETWVEQHPDDAEVWRELGRAYRRAGRPGTAVRAFAQALSREPDPATVRQLAAARAQAAPAAEPTLGGSWDSDGDAVLRFGAAADAPVGDRTRLGVAFNRARVDDGIAHATVEDLSLRARWRPSAALEVRAALGGSRLDGRAPEAPATTGPPGRPFAAAVRAGQSSVVATGFVRARWRAPGGRTALDMRLERRALDANPVLVGNGVTRTEVVATVQRRTGGAVTLRGSVRAAALRDTADVNFRMTTGAAVGYAVLPNVQVSGQFRHLSYARPSLAGYFAPRFAQTIDAGSYMEVERWGVTLALDIGAGVQRVARHGESPSSWERALRLYALAAAPLAPGREVMLEIEGYDVLVGNETAPSGGWRYLSLALSFRMALQ